MLQIVLFLTVYTSVCFAEEAQIRCGFIPNEVSTESVAYNDTCPSYACCLYEAKSCIDNMNGYHVHVTSKTSPTKRNAEIYSCTGFPSVVKPEVSAKCNAAANQCNQMTCIFRESGWMNGNKVDKKKLTEHFDAFKREFPEWSAAVDKLKTSCINSALPPQGVFLNCPAYDIMHCSATSFIQNTPPGKWNKDSFCDYARQYAAACPVCPGDCFSLLVPVGSCNACLLLPRSS